MSVDATDRFLIAPKWSAYIREDEDILRNLSGDFIIKKICSFVPH